MTIDQTHTHYIRMSLIALKWAKMDIVRVCYIVAMFGHKGMTELAHNLYIRGMTNITNIELILCLVYDELVYIDADYNINIIPVTINTIS